MSSGKWCPFYLGLNVLKVSVTATQPPFRKWSLAILQDPIRAFELSLLSTLLSADAHPTLDNAVSLKARFLLHITMTP